MRYFSLFFITTSAVFGVGEFRSCRDTSIRGMVHLSDLAIRHGSALLLFLLFALTYFKLGSIFESCVLVPLSVQ